MSVTVPMSFRPQKSVKSNVDKFLFQITNQYTMNLLLLSSLATLAVALPQTGEKMGKFRRFLFILDLLATNLCGSNERGAPRQAGDTWMEECNR